jgi:hypothetical protein
MQDMFDEMVACVFTAEVPGQRDDTGGMGDLQPGNRSPELARESPAR